MVRKQLKETGRLNDMKEAGKRRVLCDFYSPHSLELIHFHRDQAREAPRRRRSPRAQGQRLSTQASSSARSSTYRLFPQSKEKATELADAERKIREAEQRNGVVGAEAEGESCCCIVFKRVR